MKNKKILLGLFLLLFCFLLVGCDYLEQQKFIKKNINKFERKCKSQYGDDAVLYNVKAFMTGNGDTIGMNRKVGKFLFWIIKDSNGDVKKVKYNTQTDILYSDEKERLTKDATEKMELSGVKSIYNTILDVNGDCYFQNGDNIEFEKLEDTNFDSPMGEATGAAAIFGTTGGVMEAALRSAQDALTGKELEKIDFEQVRGGDGIKKATINIAGKEIKIAAVSGLKNAQEILEEIKSGKSEYQFIEIMACPGGCVMGGGQPIKSSKERSEKDIRKLRADSLYTIDEKSTIRKSHENPIVRKIYKDYLEKPGSHKAHELLHTKYEKREKYNI